MAAATLIQKEKLVLPGGEIVEIVVWHLPEPVLGSVHSFKYRLFFGRASERIVGFDNERGKGDHMHCRGVETPYAFTTIEQLVADFMAEIERETGA